MIRNYQRGYLAAGFMVLAGIFLPTGSIQAIEASPEEISLRKIWFDNHFGKPDHVSAPFSFIYDGKNSSELLKHWKFSRQSQILDTDRTEHLFLFDDSQSGLQVRCKVIEYHHFPTVEWTIHFKNTSSSETPLLENIQALDIVLDRRSDQKEFILHYNRGDWAAQSSYEPLTEVLNFCEVLEFCPTGGRPTNEKFPYYNIRCEDKGIIAVIGWPGQWASRFMRDAGTKLHLTSGQERTHFQLLAGEEVRTPLVVLQFYQGDWLRGQNIWRRWMWRHNTPRPGGKDLQPLLTSGISGQFPNMKAREEDEIKYFDRMIKERIQMDYWWIDAGWYPCKRRWYDTGTWEVDSERYPGGIRVVSDHVHANGSKLILWFEPERVTSGTWLTKNHPEWIYNGLGGCLLNLGSPECLSWLTNHMDQLITEEGVDLYRHDFNYNPVLDWRMHDAPDRQGINEIRYVEGYLAYMDELLRRHPDMLIDSCASGGRRMDLETLRRSVPLHRSDYILNTIGSQCHTYGLSLWVCYYGSPTFISFAPPIIENPYVFRSAMSPEVHAVTDISDDTFNFTLLRQMIEQWRQINPYMFGDFYPLSPYSLDTATWMAWQFNCPERDGGYVQIFRRRQDIYHHNLIVKLNGLESQALYEILNFDTNDTAQITGKELMEKGLQIVLKKQPDSAVIVYKQLP